MSNKTRLITLFFTFNYFNISIIDSSLYRINDIIELILRLFSQICCFWTGKKLIILNFTLTQNIIFEKRAANLLKMHKIAISTLKSAFEF